MTVRENNAFCLYEKAWNRSFHSSGRHSQCKSENQYTAQTSQKLSCCQVPVWSLIWSLIYIHNTDAWLEGKGKIKLMK